MGRRAALPDATLPGAAAPGLLLGQENELGVSADPAHNTPLPCEAVSTPGLVPRSARNLTHIALFAALFVAVMLFVTGALDSFDPAAAKDRVEARIARASSSGRGGTGEGRP